MSTGPVARSTLVWATRGRSWGFRFLFDGGLDDPLFGYEELFEDLQDEATVFRRGVGGLALRFPDPEGRRDAAGRPISHDVVVFGPAATRIGSLEDGVKEVWPLVRETYARVWGLAGPPSAADLR